MKNLYAVIMAGGSGERFWPRSRSSKPKQLLSIVGKNTMIQETVKRISQKIPPRRIFIVTSKRYLNQIRSQLPRIIKENIIIEPFGRNTASAIGLAALWVKKKDPDAVMVVLPSDHIIKDKSSFLKAISRAASAAKAKGWLMTLGLVPKSAFTGYGYIKTGSKVNSKKNGGGFLFTVKRFIEKPNKENALKFVCSGDYLWNSGIFVWKARDILAAIDEFMPELSKSLKVIAPKIGAKDYLSSLNRIYKRLRNVSIDNGVLEKARNIYCVQAELDWDDIGSWANMAFYGKMDPSRNISMGLHKGIDTSDSIIIAQPGHLIGTVGLRGVVVVSTKDATLVCARHRAQDVRELVQKLKSSEKLNRFA